MQLVSVLCRVSLFFTKMVCGERDGHYWLTMYQAELTSRSLCVVISLFKICDRDWSYTRHMIVEIIAVAQCINIPGQHSCSRSTVPGNITSQHYWGT